MMVGALRLPLTMLGMMLASTILSLSRPRTCSEQILEWSIHITLVISLQSETLKWSIHIALVEVFR